MNFLAIFVAALMPMLVGFIWYNPKVMGTAWQRESGITDEQIQGGNMPLIFGLAFFFSLVLAAMVNTLVVHQFHVQSLLINEPGFNDPSSELGMWFADFQAKYGMLHRTVTHGLVHGFMSSLLFALPLITINSLFERRSAKYILIHFGYWTLTLMLMGAVICAWV